MEVGDPYHIDYKEDATRYCTVIHNWVFSWMNGKLAHMKEEYELSKDLLFLVLDMHKGMMRSIGGHHISRIKKWSREKILP